MALQREKDGTICVVSDLRQYKKVGNGYNEYRTFRPPIDVRAIGR